MSEKEAPVKSVDPVIQGTLAGMEGLLSAEDFNQLKSELKIEDTPPATPPATPETPPATPPITPETPPATPPATPETPPATPPATPETPEAEIEVDSPLMGGKHKLGQKKEETPAIPGIEKIDPETMKAILKPFGVDSIDKLVTSVNKFRADSEKLTSIEEKNAKYEEVWAKMPDDLFESIQAWTRNEDYRQVINSRPALDFNKDISQVDNRSLVDTYFKGQFTQEEWDDYKDPEGSAATKKAINIAIEQSKDKFSLDKNKFVNGRANLVKQQNERMQKIDASIESSVSLLTEKLPVDSSYAENIKKALRSGGDRSLFRAEDGTLLPDAALRYALAEHGLSLIQQLQTIAERTKETQMNQQLLSRGAEQARGKGAADNAQPSKPFQEFVTNVLPKQKSSTY